MKIRKKPIVVEAVSVHDILNAPSSTPDWVEESIAKRLLSLYEECVVIMTPNGRVRAEYGEYVVLGTAGELYPISKEILAETYEVIP